MNTITIDVADRPEDFIKMLVVLRDRKCQYRDCSSIKTLEVHHILSKGKGGTNNENNLITYCRHHHNMQHSNNMQTKVLLIKKIILETPNISISSIAKM